MATVTITVNDKSYTADGEKTILQVVREHGIDDIPTLCYEDRLHPITACFLCVVEVEGARGLVPSCSTRVQQGMVVRTRTDKVMEARRTCLELLFSDHPADCVSPCSMKCPAGVDIQGYVALVSKGLYHEAVELIKEKNPLPIVCGRVCVRECEVGCRRNLIDTPVAIDHIKRFAAESKEGMSFREKQHEPRHKSVGIVGAGPAGLSASYYLAREGYEVTVYEAMPAPGGMLLYGIPAYRLPKDLLAREIDKIRAMGVRIECGSAIGPEVTVTELKGRHDVLLLSPGAWGASMMKVKNENAPGVLPGLQLLRDVAMGTVTRLEGKVLIVGGGNTAVDAARTAVRLGATETTLLYRRTEKEMPAHYEEIHAARQEGVQFRFLVAPSRVITDEQGRARGLECLKMELGAPDGSGRRKPVAVEGSAYVEEGDWIVAAIGQVPDLRELRGAGEEELPLLTAWGCIKVQEATMETTVKGIFSAGDVVTGPATVIEGIAGGRRAAVAIHRYLSQGEAAGEKREFMMSRELLAPVSKDELPLLSCGDRHVMPERDALLRVRDFHQVELGLSKGDAEGEAARCLSCGCVEAGDCVLRKYGSEYDVRAGHYRGDANRHRVDTRHPFIMIDAAKCIKCGRCVRTCEKILGAPALGFVHRGFHTMISPALGKSLVESNCISCGNCIDSCPTGALAENQPLLATLEDRLRETPTVCSFCSAGCTMKIRAFGRDVRIRSLRDRGTGEGDYLCRKGRFGSRYLSEGGRLEQPYMRRDGRVLYMNWQASLEHAARSLGDIKNSYGAESIGVFLSPRLTNEEIYGAVKFARGVIGTDYTGSLRELLAEGKHHELDPVLGRTCSTARASDIEKCDTILLVNANPCETHPAIGWSIMEARRRGAKVLVISSAPPALDAHLWLQPRRGSLTHLLSALMHELLNEGLYDREFTAACTEHLPLLKEFLKGARAIDTARCTGISPELIQMMASMLSRGKVTALYDMDAPLDRSRNDLSALLQLLLLTGNMGKEGAGLLLLEHSCNSTGLYDLGGEPGYLPGRVPFHDDGHRRRLETLWGLTLKGEGGRRSLREHLVSGELRGALVVGENPFADPLLAQQFKACQFLAVCDLFPSETTETADLVLPASSHVESGGSFTGFDGTVRHFAAAFPPPGGMTTLQVISRLGLLMGAGTFSGDYGETKQELAEIPGLYETGSVSQWERLTGKGKKASFAPYLMDLVPSSCRTAEYDSISLRYERGLPSTALRQSLTVLRDTLTP